MLINIQPVAALTVTSSLRQYQEGKYTQVAMVSRGYQPVAEPVAEPVAGPVTEPVAEPVAEHEKAWSARALPTTCGFLPRQDHMASSLMPGLSGSAGSATHSPYSTEYAALGQHTALLPKPMRLVLGLHT